MVAFDSETGKELWRVDRDEASNWATPFIWENDGATEIVTQRPGSIRSYDLDGKLLWELGGACLASPSRRRSRGTGCSTSPRATSAIRSAGLRHQPGASGDISLKPGGRNQFIAWSQPPGRTLQHRRRSSTATTTTRCSTAASSRATTPGPARRSTAKSGSIRAAGGFTASPWAYNGKIFALSEDGDTLRDAGRAGVQAARQELARRDGAGDAGHRARQPVIRTASKLYRITAPDRPSATR